jgi:hypothetical protein
MLAVRSPARGRSRRALTIAFAGPSFVKLGELGRDCVDAEHRRPGEQGEDDEIEPQVQLGDDPTDLGAHAIAAELARKRTGRPGHVLKEASPLQSRPAVCRRTEIGQL